MAPEHGILADSAIRLAIQEGDIEIDPYNPDHVNPASVDLTLGDEVRVYKRAVCYDETYDVRPTLGGFASGLSMADITGKPRDGSDIFPANGGVYLDVKEEPSSVAFKINPEVGWVLKPGIGYLMHTRERVHTKKFVPVLDGKSSIGRLFIQVHVTAGYGDPGFNGQFTLEVTALHPIRIYPGMRICQVRFHTMRGEVGNTYDKTGHYTQEAATGAVASQAFRMFRKP